MDHILWLLIFFFFVIAIYTGSHKSGNMSPVSQTVQKCETWSIPAYSNAIIILIMILSKLESCWVSYEKNIMKIHVQTCCYWWIIKRLFQHANRCKGLSHTLTMFLKSFFFGHWDFAFFGSQATCWCGCSSASRPLYLCTLAWYLEYCCISSFFVTF